MSLESNRRRRNMRSDPVDVLRASALVYPTINPSTEPGSIARVALTVYHEAEQDQFSAYSRFLTRKDYRLKEIVVSFPLFRQLSPETSIGKKIVTTIRRDVDIVRATPRLDLAFGDAMRMAAATAVEGAIEYEVVARFNGRKFAIPPEDYARFSQEATITNNVL